MNTSSLKAEPSTQDSISLTRSVSKDSISVLGMHYIFSFRSLKSC